MGVSHECDFPPEVVAHLPKLTRSSLAHGLSSAEIDQAVSQQVGEGHSLYGLDEELLTQLRPDLVVTQELCDVCAVSFSEVKRLAKLLPGNPPVLSLNPPNIEGIFEDVISVARAARSGRLRGELIGCQPAAPIATGGEVCGRKAHAFSLYDGMARSTLFRRALGSRNGTIGGWA